MAIKPIKIKRKELVKLSSVNGRASIITPQLDLSVITMGWKSAFINIKKKSTVDGAKTVGTIGTQVLRGSFVRIGTNEFQVFCTTGVTASAKSFMATFKNIPEEFFQETPPDLTLNVEVEYEYYPASASLFESTKLNKNVDPLDTKELVERILSESLNRIMRIDENRSSSEFKKASDTMVSAFERWEKYAKTGDWDLKDAQYVIGNLEYIIKGIKKLA